MNKKRIVIATPLVFPQIGGGALYTDIFYREWKKAGMDVSIVSFGNLLKFPTGIRHIFYALKLCTVLWRTDVVYVLDTFSVAFPSVVLGHLLSKKVIVRVGGDFLWEQYVERTKEKILLSEFYNEERPFTFKENAIYEIIHFVFRYASVVVFSTEWQKNICIPAYSIDTDKVSVIENIYPSRTKRNIVPKNRHILSASRDIFLKNKEGLKEAFVRIQSRFFDAVLDTHISSHEEMLRRVSEAYMVVTPSLSEVSPNSVLDALSLGVPVVCTSDCGMKERLGDVVVWVDPRNPGDIARGMEMLMDARTYSEYMARISKYAYVHTEQECALSFLTLAL